MFEPIEDAPRDSTGRYRSQWIDQAVIALATIKLNMIINGRLDQLEAVARHDAELRDNWVSHFSPIEKIIQEHMITNHFEGASPADAEDEILVKHFISQLFDSSEETP
jgi:hypothetical protein